MAAISNSYFEVVTAATSTSSTFVTPTGAEILGSNLQGSTEYLLCFVAYVGGDNAAVNTFGYQILENGVGALTASVAQHEIQNTNSLRGGLYMYMARVTTAASPNDYEFQFRESAGTNTVHMASCRGFAIELDDLTENTHFFWNEDTTTREPTNAGYTDGASVTVGNGVDDYLILSTSQALVDAAGIQILQRINAGGTAFAEIVTDSEDVVEQRCHGTLVYLPAPSSSTVVKNQFSTSSATTGDIDIVNNRIFALNLSAFEDAAGTYDAGPFDLTSIDTTYDVETLGHTTATAASRDWFVIGNTISVPGTNAQLRMALYDNATATTIGGDVTSGGSAPKTQGWATSDATPALVFGKLSGIANSTTLDIDLKVQEDTTAGVDVAKSSIVAFALETAAADVTAPILSNPTALSITQTTVTPRCTTDEGNGTMYMVVVPDGDVPSVTQIKNGQQSSGSAAIAADNDPISSSGAHTFAQVTGLTISTSYELYFVHRDAAGNDSSASTVGFTTSAAAPAFNVLPSVGDKDTNSFTLTFQSDASATIYSVAVKRGETAPTVANVKAGQKNGGGAADAAANKAVTTAADTLVLGGSLDLPLYDIYSVLNNGSGDSSLATLTSQFLDPAAGKQFVIVNVLEVASVTKANPPVVTTTDDHGFSTGQLIRPYGGDMTQFNAEHANYAGNISPDPDDGELYFQITVTGAKTFTLDGLNSTGWDTYTTGAVAPPGFSFFQGASPAVVDNDIWELDVQTVPDFYNIIAYPGGTLIYTEATSEQQRIEMRVYDVSAEAWTAYVLQYLNNSVPILTNPFPDPMEFLQNVAFSLDPVKGVYVEDPDNDTVTLSLIAGWPGGIAIGGGGDSIEGTTTDSPSTSTQVLRATDESGEFTDFNINIAVIETFQMPDVVNSPTFDVTEAAAISAITGAGLASPTIIYAVSQTVTIGNVISQTPNAGEYQPADYPTTITVSSPVDLTGIPPGWFSVSNALVDNQFQALMRIEADGSAVWAYWVAGVDLMSEPLPKAWANIRLNLTLIKAEADGNAGWARWSPGRIASNRGLTMLQLDMQEALLAGFVET